MSERNVTPFHVRMPDELKQRLEKKAKNNGRSLNAEILDRLRSSLDRAGATLMALQEPGLYGTPALHGQEQQLLTYFRDMPPEKQLALISLLK